MKLIPPPQAILILLKYIENLNNISSNEYLTWKVDARIDNSITEIGQPLSWDEASELFI